MTMRCYIVDDEFHAIDVLTDYISMTPGLELAGSNDCAPAGLREVTTSPPDIIFLDVDMPRLNGLDFANMVSSFTKVIFTTSYREYAADAFEKDASDYLLKPISYERFLLSIQRLKRKAAPLPILPPPEQTLFIKSGIKGNMTAVAINEIIYISGADNYVELHFSNKKIMAYLTLNEFQERLPLSEFSRIHKSYIISHKFIRSLEYAQVRLEGQIALPIGRSYREAFTNKLSVSYLVSKRDHFS